MKITTEEQFQSACAIWFHNTFPSQRKMLFTVDNNVSRRLSGMDRAIEGNRKKQQGIQPGVSDFIFINHYSVQFIELKLWDGRQSEEQKEFERMVRLRGHQYWLIYCEPVGVGGDGSGVGGGSVGGGSTDQLINFKNLMLCLVEIAMKTIGK